jgi:hypothetical protein
VILAYSLTMPGKGSWDGCWSQESREFALVRTYRGAGGNEKAKKILATPSYRYAWGDGWCAAVSVRAVDASEAAKIRRRTHGFCSYDWMVDSIEQDQRIITPEDRKALEEAPCQP